MKIKVFILISFIFILMTACSNSAVSDKLLYSDNLKSITDAKREQLQWTQELEKNRLSERITTIEYINQGNKLIPNTMMAFEAGMGRQAIYPELNGFGSLDISDIDPNALAVVSKFCGSLLNNGECESFFDENSLYSLVLLLHDLEKYDFSKNWWYAGKGYFEGSVVEIPVRFTNGINNLDLNIYLKEVDAKTDDKQKDVPTMTYKIIDVEIAGF